MRFKAIDDGEKRIGIELDETEADHLLRFLLQAKFSDDVRMEVVGCPSMNVLLRGIFETQKALGLGVYDPNDWAIPEVDGIQPSRSFIIIEQELQRWLGREDVEEELAEHLYPWTWIKRSSIP